MNSINSSSLTTEVTNGPEGENNDWEIVNSIGECDEVVTKGVTFDLSQNVIHDYI